MGSTTLSSYATNKTENQAISYSCKEYNEARKGDAYALNYYALRNRKNLRGTPSQRFVFIFGTIILTIGKKLGIVKSTPEDFMLGAKAKEIDKPMSYTELMNMDRRQRRVLDLIGIVFFYFIQFVASA